MFLFNCSNCTHLSNFYTFEVVGRVSKTQRQVGEDLNSGAWRVMGYDINTVMYIMNQKVL